MLPFTLADTAPNGWSSGYIIAIIVVGFVVLVLFGLYESFLAPVPFLNAKLLTDRTVVGACILDATYQVSYYCCNKIRFSTFCTPAPKAALMVSSSGAKQAAQGAALSWP